MKQEFSTSWLSSTQPRKQRKFRLNAPLHQKHIFLSAHLSDELQSKYGRRAAPLRKGDEVLIMRGSFKKKSAKVSKVDLKRTRVVLEGITRTKKDGSKINVYFHPSVLQIQSLEAGDKERLSALNRKSGNSKPSTQENVEKQNKNSKSKESNK